jgi:CheY-like chemotaxis protein
MDADRKATILIADDDGETRNILERLLQERGYSTRAVDSGAAALQSVSEEPPDLILLDGNMPGMDGFEVVKRLKSEVRTRTDPHDHGHRPERQGSPGSVPWRTGLRTSW